MPIYEFQCEGCGGRFEELVPTGTSSHACPACGSDRTLRLLSTVSPPGRQPRGPRVRAGESMRTEREAIRRDRLAATGRKRAAGEIPPPRRREDSR